MKRVTLHIAGAFCKYKLILKTLLEYKTKNIKSLSTGKTFTTISFSLPRYVCKHCNKTGYYDRIGIFFVIQKKS